MRQDINGIATSGNTNLVKLRQVSPGGQFQPGKKIYRKQTERQFFENYNNYNNKMICTINYTIKYNTNTDQDVEDSDSLFQKAISNLQ